MPHPKICVLCDQEEEDIQHILVSCVFSRQIWFSLLDRVGFSVLAPQLDDTSFEEWWIKTDKLVPSVFTKCLNSLIVLGAWMIWKQHNDGVFNGASPNVSRTLSLIKEEDQLWGLACARELLCLPAVPVPIGT
ncbi:hypothetical protein PR202_gb15994 [Eleusine coracana subsp. coracana]|uniref:Reverse transcriptase zinc-binding domain-containing protein n=1 Tax=Eleusine coracana subsp. coracana TaxID=191504 RepID=A0AAV5EX27_ELECO|nr:hypothetical protein PR202_gb15994 [Eleusine coracana subsp. coracana]